ncbi:MAG: HAMP domain-containing sensor histidine kinase, partial [Flavobacteriaceae bacterium]
MGVNFRNSNSFIVRYTIILTLISTVFISGLLYVIGGFNAAYMLLLTPLLLITNFLVLRIGVDKYVFKLLQHLYSEVSLLEDFELKEGRVSTDLKSLTSDIEEFARGKKIEIETLKIREEYRKDFLGNVAHEMKTPLFTIQGYILTLLDGAMQDKKVRKKYLERANKSVDRLLYIVKDLDTITRLESGSQKLHMQPMDIVELIESDFEMLEMKATKKDITLVFDKVYEHSVWVNGDAEKLEHVLSNLIENSIKYGHQGGTTEVTIEELTEDKL